MTGDRRGTTKNRYLIPLAFIINLYGSFLSIIGSVRLSHSAPAYLSDWDPAVRVTHAPTTHFTHNSLRRKDPIGPREQDNSTAPSRCARFVRYEGSMTVLGINIVGLMMLIRCAPASALVNLPS